MTDDFADAIKRLARLAVLKVVTLAQKYYRWRGECPTCGDQRQNLTSPYGWVCDNPECRRQAISKIKKKA